MSDNVLRHRAICDELNALYEKKNRDYGDSFHLSFLEEGMAMARIRLGDKLNRFKQLSKNPDSQSVNDESIRDTLIDLANYAIMSVLEMDRSDKKASDETSDESTVLKYRGELIRLRQEGNEYTVDSATVVICDICKYLREREDVYPCNVCCHGGGSLEYFTLNTSGLEG